MIIIVVIRVAWLAAAGEIAAGASCSPRDDHPSKAFPIAANQPIESHAVFFREAEQVIVLQPAPSLFNFRFGDAVFGGDKINALADFIVEIGALFFFFPGSWLSPHVDQGLHVATDECLVGFTERRVNPVELLREHAPFRRLRRRRGLWPEFDDFCAHCFASGSADRRSAAWRAAPPFRAPRD
jgi:hypothetical protein